MTINNYYNHVVQSVIKKCITATQEISIIDVIDNANYMLYTA